MGKTKELKKWENNKKNTNTKTQKQINIKNQIKIKKSDILFFWMDTIECFWNFKNKSDCFFNSVFSDLDYDVNFSIADDIEIEFSTKPSKYLYKLLFKKDWISCFAYYEWTQISANITTKNYYTVYWKGWKVLWSKRVFEILDKYFEFSSFRRLDLSCDLLLPIDEILFNFSKLFQKWADFFWDLWNRETHYIWDVKKQNNKYMLIRIYDKLKEIRKEKTQKLYTNYLIHKNVTRIEISFREETSKFIKWEESKDYDNYSFNLFCSKLEKHTSLFLSLQTKKIKLKIADKSVDLSSLKPEEILESHYLKNFKWYARNLLEVWICPINLLLMSSLYDSLTLWDVINSQNSNKFNLDDYKSYLTYRDIKQIFRS